jgi:hypothetical protein
MKFILQKGCDLKAAFYQSRVEQFNGRGRRAQLLYYLCCQLHLNGLGSGFAARHLSRYVASIFGMAIFKDC